MTHAQFGDWIYLPDGAVYNVHDETPREPLNDDGEQAATEGE